MSSITTYAALETAALEILAQLRGLPADGGKAEVIERLKVQDHEDAAAAAEIAGNCKDEPAGGHSWEVVGSKKKKKAQQTTKEPVVPQCTAFSWTDEGEEDLAASMAQDNTLAISTDTEGTPAPTSIVDGAAAELASSVLHTVLHINTNEPVDLQVIMDGSEEGADDVEDLQAAPSSEDAGEEENGEDVEVVQATPSSEEAEEENGEDLEEASAEENMTCGGASSATSMSAEEVFKPGCETSWKAMKMRRARKMEGVVFEPLYLSSDDEDEVKDAMPNDEANTDSSPTEAPPADKKKFRKRGKKGGRKAHKQAQMQANKLADKTGVEQGGFSAHKLNIMMGAMAIGALSFALGVVATRRV
jgi:hypothetical protein